MTHIRLWTIILLYFWLTGCATVTEAPKDAQNKTIAWDTREQKLASIHSWDLKGLIAIRAREAVSANMQWQQQGKAYHIALYGPLGSQNVELRGQPGRVELLAANGKRASASSPESLLAKEVGWRLPVSNLYYWIRGLPVPDLAAEKKFDSYNHLIQLQQDGWNIQYLRYTAANSVDLPSKIFLNNPGLNVKIIISQWGIS